jgi:hypothetical protein
MRAKVFDEMYFLILSLLSLLFKLDIVIFTLGVGIILSTVTLCIGFDRVRTGWFVTLGFGMSVCNSSGFGGLDVVSNVTRRVSIGRVSFSGVFSDSSVGSGSGTLFKMTSNFTNASI